MRVLHGAIQAFGWGSSQRTALGYRDGSPGGGDAGCVTDPHGYA